MRNDSRVKKVVIRARELEDGEQYRQPLPPVDQSIQFNIEDDFPLEHRVHTYTTTVEDEQGREHILRLQWAHGLKLRTVGLLFSSVGIFITM